MATPEYPIRFERNPIITEKIPDGYPTSVHHDYVGIIQGAHHYSLEHDQYVYLSDYIVILKECNNNMSYLFDYGVRYITTRESDDEKERIAHAAQDTLDQYARDRVEAIRLINLLQTPCRYDLTRVKEDFYCVVEDIKQDVLSLERTFEVTILDD